jgi:hypothetical protein
VSPALEEAALYDDQFTRECAAVPRATCELYGNDDDECSGCPAWAGLQARIDARTTAGEPRAVLTRRSES